MGSLPVLLVVVRGMVVSFNMYINSFNYCYINHFGY